MLVEDHPELRNYVADVLVCRYQVVVMRNGREALDYLTAGHPIDLIVTDIMMPALDGYQLVQKIRANPVWSNIPVLILSARADRVDQEKAFRLGVDDYLIKPFEQAELLLRLEQLLVRRTVRTVLSDGMAVTEEQRLWLQQLEETVQDKLSDFSLTAEIFAMAMFVGRSSFFEKVKMLTGFTPTQYIQEARLLRARYLLEHQPITTLKELAKAVGYKDEKNFSALFKQRFGKSPVNFFQDTK